MDELIRSSELRGRAIWYLLPVVDAHGYQRTWAGERFLRTTENGENPNLNFPYRWGEAPPLLDAPNTEHRPLRSPRLRWAGAASSLSMVRSAACTATPVWGDAKTVLLEVAAAKSSTGPATRRGQRRALGSDSGVVSPKLNAAFMSVSPEGTSFAHSQHAHTTAATAYDSAALGMTRSTAHQDDGITQANHERCRASR